MWRADGLRVVVVWLAAGACACALAVRASAFALVFALFVAFLAFGGAAAEPSCGSVAYAWIPGGPPPWSELSLLFRSSCLLIFFPLLSGGWRLPGLELYIKSN